MSSLVIGSRGSILARTQSELTRDALLETGLVDEISIHIIKTRGDIILDVPLAKVGGKGLFVKEIEQALLAGQIDIAVHSMKDMPTVQPDGLVIGAVPPREDPRDVVVLPEGKTEVPQSPVFGTSSLRRSSQLLACFPGTSIQPLRGNVDTRVRRLEESNELDAIVLAMAGLKRMGKAEELNLLPLSTEEMLPAVGQGALAIQCRSDDTRVLELLGHLHHEESAVCTVAERAFLKGVEGSCQVPVAAHATLDSNGILQLHALVARLDGSEVFRRSGSGAPEDGEALGIQLASELLDGGGREVLQDCIRAFEQANND
ncbi:MAG: hydroxymethylbilane synthase [Myxococcales bacterium]|nr:hydroxymethylbilane synthase [Myxococcales bacterium]